MSAPEGNSEFYFPKTLNVSETKSSTFIQHMYLITKRKYFTRQNECKAEITSPAAYLAV